jgi:hypothetical protein
MIFFRDGVDEIAAAVSQVELRNGATVGLLAYEDMTGKDGIVTVSAPPPPDCAHAWKKSEEAWQRK